MKNSLELATTEAQLTKSKLSVSQLNYRCGAISLPSYYIGLSSLCGFCHSKTERPDDFLRTCCVSPACGLKFGGCFNAASLCFFFSLLRHKPPQSCSHCHGNWNKINILLFKALHTATHRALRKHDLSAQPIFRLLFCIPEYIIQM